MINSTIITGRTTRDIELRYTQSGLAIANFNVAVDRAMSKAKKQEAEASGKQTADFINVVCFNHTAEFVGNYLKKGKMVAVEGRLQSGKYENKEGQTIYTTDILANNIQVLEWADDYDNRKPLKEEQISQDFHPVENTDIPF